MMSRNVKSSNNSKVINMFVRYEESDMTEKTKDVQNSKYLIELNNNEKKQPPLWYTNCSKKEDTITVTKSNKKLKTVKSENSLTWGAYTIPVRQVFLYDKTTYPDVTEEEIRQYNKIFQYLNQKELQKIHCVDKTKLGYVLKLH